MFGSQMSGMSEMLIQTANTIQTASQRFEQLAGQIEQAGTGAADAMAKRMDESMQQMQVRQAEANDQMRFFIDQLKTSVASSQSDSAELTMGMMRELSDTTSALVQGLRDQAHAAEQHHSNQQSVIGERVNGLLEQMQTSMARHQAESSDNTQRLMGQLGESAGGMVRTLQDQALKAQEEHSLRQSELTAKSSALMDEQSAQIARLTDAVQQASSSMQNTVERLQAQAQASIDSMGQGAEKLYGASARLGDNLDNMKTNSDSLNNMAEKLSGSALTLGNALTATQVVLNDQRSVRDALASLVTDLRATIELTKREASLSAGLVDSLQTASQRLTEAQRTTETYLQGVTDVLGEAHGAFAQQVTATLREGNKVFHEELASATNHLRGAIQDLGDVLDNMPSAT
jgi:hypothetical protein